MAAAAEARMSALKLASQQQQLWSESSSVCRADILLLAKTQSLPQMFWKGNLCRALLHNLLQYKPPQIIVTTLKLYMVSAEVEYFSN